MLRSIGKENVTPIINHDKSASKIRSSLKVFQGILSSQKEINPTGELTANKINFEVFETQLKKLTEACENERKEKWGHSQARNKLQNEVKVLQIEKENQVSENKKLRGELNDLISKMKEIQAKSNNQISEFYTLKNENASMQIQLRKYQDCEKKWSEKFQQLKTTKTGLENQIKRLQVQTSEWRNECKLRETQIDLLRRNMAELEFQNKRFGQVTQANSQISDQKFDQICQELQTWKSAFEKKEQQLETRTVVLQEENSMMRKTIGQFSSQMAQSKTSIQRTVSLPSQSVDRTNEYHVRLFVKESQIEKLNEALKQLEDKVQTLEVQNALLAKKCTQGTVFSPMGYQRYNEIQNSIMKNSDLKRQARQLKILVESKQKEIECLVEKINESALQMESVLIESRKFESEIEHERIIHQNVVSETNANRTKLEREVQILKSKLEILRKDCEQKDRIIMTHVNRQKQNL